MKKLIFVLMLIPNFGWAEGSMWLCANSDSSTVLEWTGRPGHLFNAVPQAITLALLDGQNLGHVDQLDGPQLSMVRRNKPGNAEFYIYGGDVSGRAVQVTFKPEPNQVSPVAAEILDMATGRSELLSCENGGF